MCECGFYIIKVEVKNMAGVTGLVGLKDIDGSTVITDGIVYVSDYSVIPFGNAGKKRLAGTFKNKGEMKGFKTFESTIVNFFDTHNLMGCVLKISGKGDVYNGKTEIMLTGVGLEVGSYTDKDFIKAVDVNTVFGEFSDFIKTELDSNYYEVMKLILNVRINEFVTAFAGAKMHDAQVGGLMNHELKMLRIAKVLVANDARLEPYKNILYSGIALHDFGKIYEMDKGIYTKNSFVTHRTMGVEIIAQNKTEIVNLIGETNYYHLLAVIQGHHGEYGDKPTTVWAYLVHLIDMLESQATGIMDKVEGGDTSVSSANNDTVYVNGSNLVL